MQLIERQRREVICNLDERWKEQVNVKDEGDFQYSFFDSL